MARFSTVKRNISNRLAAAGVRTPNYGLSFKSFSPRRTTMPLGFRSWSGGNWLEGAGNQKLFISPEGEKLVFQAPNQRPLATEQLSELRDSLRTHARVASEGPLFGMEVEPTLVELTAVPTLSQPHWQRLVSASVNEVYHALFPGEVQLDAALVAKEKLVAILRARETRRPLNTTEASLLQEHALDVDAYRPFSSTLLLEANQEAALLPVKAESGTSDGWGQYLTQRVDPVQVLETEQSIQTPLLTAAQRQELRQFANRGSVKVQFLRASPAKQLKLALAGKKPESTIKVKGAPSEVAAYMRRVADSATPIEQRLRTIEASLAARLSPETAALLNRVVQLAVIEHQWAAGSQSMTREGHDALAIGNDELPEALRLYAHSVGQIGLSATAENTLVEHLSLFEDALTAVDAVRLQQTRLSADAQSTFLQWI